MANLTIDFIAHSIGVPFNRIYHSSDVKLDSIQFSRAHTDSRTCKMGDLFIPLKGENFDGHKFILDAIENGAIAILCQEDLLDDETVNPNIIYFPVPDVLQAYREVAHAWRKAHDLPVFLVAGSAGKTTTKELMASCLSGKFKNILKTDQSQNGFIGVAMTLLKLGQTHDAAVIEVGIDDLGAMEKHLEIITPTAGIVTSISEEHLFNLKSIENVAIEECKVYDYCLKHDLPIVLNLGDTHLAKYAADANLRDLPENQYFPLKIFDSNEEFKTQPDDIKAIAGLYKRGDLKLILQGRGFQKKEIKLPLPGIHNAENVMASLSASILLGLTPDEAVKGLENFKPVFGRTEIENWKGVLVIKDYYNANPASMERALSLLSELSEKRTGTRWVCLGEMRELGEKEEMYHCSLVKPILAAGVKGVLLTGKLMTSLAEELTNSEFSSDPDSFLVHHQSKDELTKILKSSLRDGDSLLIKGSRGMKMEQIWDLLQ